MEKEAIIEVENLTKHFRKIHAVDSLSLNVYKGDVFGFLGPNGAGKSTTIRMLLTLIFPNSGWIKLFGLPLHQNRRSVLRRVGAIVEKPDFYNYLTAYKNLEILGKLSGISIEKKKIMEMLEFVGLAERYNSRVKTLSHGMKQRLGIAQAILHDPELIILDEPTTGLDPQGMKEIRDLIVRLSSQRSKTILLSTHILHEVELVANRMIIINKGSAVVEGYVDDLLNTPQTNVRFTFSDTGKARQFVSNSRIGDKTVEIGDRHAIFNLSRAEIPELNKYFVDSGIGIESIVPIRSLEELFLKLTESN